MSEISASASGVDPHKTVASVGFPAGQLRRRGRFLQLRQIHLAEEILVAPIGPDIRRNIVTDAQKPPVVLTKGAIKPRKCLVKIVTHGVLPVMSSRIICAPES